MQNSFIIHGYGPALTECILHGGNNATSKKVLAEYMKSMSLLGVVFGSEDSLTRNQLQSCMKVMPLAGGSLFG